MNNEINHYQLDESAQTVTLQGALTFETVTALFQSLSHDVISWPKLVFDLKSVSRADSAALAFMMEWIHWANKQNKQICFQHLPGNLLSIIEASRLHGLLDNYMQ